MTIEDYKLKYKLETYLSSAGDNLKTVCSVIYKSYNPKIIDLLIAVNSQSVNWRELEDLPMTEIKYVRQQDVGLISELL